MKKILAAFGIALAALAAYLGLWPVPVEPQSWEAPVAPGYVGPFAVNNKLADLKTIPLGAEEGPEHLVVARDGKLYATVASGAILRMNPDGSGQEVVANTGGRVLGFDFDPAGNLIAADAFKGLLSISPDRKVTVLADKAAGTPILYANAVVVARNGKVYFSDASNRFGAKAWGGTFEASILDILEQSATGRVIEYDPAAKTTRIVAKGFSFANGVALSQDERSLFVAETGRYRIWKLPVDAREQDVSQPGAGLEPLFDNLPGYPDNLMRGLDGKVWVGLVKPRNPTIDGLARKPFVRKVILRLPRALWPIPKAYGHVVAFTEDGKVVADLQDPSGAYPETTAVTETADRLYVQSLHARELGWLPK
ncbi:Sugar lactone lactonase YvrE [Polaromonas sp. YR568]|uniref:SMP-30/gluconolactonase/LRE family protein n=1 Tax=Polaromonas sp. YR568 TaxID=1855301 RepID=UPI0008E9386F|nr:SMP-30/gluconolactonase/LRE family protein [Polaromonas sp. YR568]SFU28420.1 Sugar lactone lactonase YvrE [Polaromonas sp. YR568]